MVMKKWISAVLATVVCLTWLASCAATEVNTQEMTISFESGIFPQQDWDDSKGTYRKDAIPDEQTAIRAARVAFKRAYGEQNAKMHPAISLVYDDDDEAWLVFFARTHNTLGGYSIAIQKSDGKILQIEYGE